MTDETLRFGSYAFEVSRLDKTLFPDAAITKGDLIEYYQAVADRMLPYLRDRPVVMHRFPDGIDAEGFYQKATPDYFPDWIDTVTVRKEGGTVRHVVCGNEATLVYLAGQGVITPHVWLSRVDRLHHPDRLIFDLDPPDESSFDLVREAALALHGLLEDELDLSAWPMTTGGRGVHVVVPLDRSSDFDTVRDFAARTARVLAAREPDRFTTETRKESRKGRLFLDYLRNAYAQTSVPPLAVRPRPGAPVAMPLAWEEVGDPDLRGNRYRIGNARKRLAGGEDPWGGLTRHARALGPRIARLEDVEKEIRP